MKRLLVTCISGLLLVLAVSAANAQPGSGYISVAANDCLSGGGLASFTNNCAGTTTGYLVGAYQLTNPQTQFVGVTFVFDMQEEGATDLSPWWQWDNLCTGTSSPVSVFTDPSLNPFFSFTCSDPWSLSAGTVAASSSVQRPSQGSGLGPASQRFIVAATLPASSPASLAAGTDYAAVTLRYRRLAANTAACAGCANPITFVLNSVLSGQLVGAPGGNVTITDPLPFPSQAGAFFSNCLGINGSNACPTGATPTQNRTWGQVKSLYR